MGDVHRIPRSKDKKFSDPCFEKLLSMDIEKLPTKRSPFFTNPAYRYTKAEIGGIK